VAVAQSSDTVNLSSYEPYKAAAERAAAEMARLDDLRAELARVETEKASIEATAGPDDVDRIAEAELAITKLARQIEFQERIVAERQAEVGDLIHPARGNLYGHFQEKYLEAIVDFMDAIDAAILARKQMYRIINEHRAAAEVRNPRDLLRVKGLDPEPPVWFTQALASGQRWREGVRKIAARRKRDN
jgi:hypothetical protein